MVPPLDRYTLLYTVVAEARPLNKICLSDKKIDILRTILNRSPSQLLQVDS